MSEDPDGEEELYYKNPDLIELSDHMGYLPDGKHYHSNHGSYGINRDGFTERVPVDYRYPAATYRPGRAPEPRWAGDTYLGNAKYTGATLNNPYMNFVNATWMV